jgi:hypothetical protein
MARSDHLNTKLLDSANGTLSVTSGSFTPQSNSLLVVVIGVMACTDASGPPVIDTANSSLSGGSLTWTRRIGVNSGGMSFSYSRCLEIWTAPVGTAASMTLNWTNTFDQGTFATTEATRVAVQAFSYTDYDTGTPTGATCSDSTLSTSGTGAMTLSGSPASSSWVVLAREINQDGTTDITATPDTGGGFAEIYDVPAVTGSEGYACMETQERTGSTSTSVEWDDINANAQTVFGEAIGVGLEIKASGGGGKVTKNTRANPLGVEVGMGWRIH